MNTLEQLKAARKVSTPIISIITADPPATVAGLVNGFKGSNVPPILQHDVIRGIVGLNDAGKEARATLSGDDSGLLPGTVQFQSPAEALSKATELPARALLFVHNAGPLIQDVAVTQALCNLRDLFKMDGRTCVLLGSEITLPAALAQDVFTIDVPYPAEDDIRRIIDQEYENISISRGEKAPKKPDAPKIDRAVEALIGLAEFPIEQAVAFSIESTGTLDGDQLWGRKRGYIRQTRGLGMDDERITFADLGGLQSFKTYGGQIFSGPERPRVVVRLDEIEKMLAGAAGDTSGTSQDQLGTILRDMEDNGWVGLIAVGPPGSGKSAGSKALGTTHDVPTFSFDLGAAKGSLVGQSEERIRAAMKVIKAVAGKYAYFVATCNAIDAAVIKPELLRRFTDGIWYFDLPTDEEKSLIWPIALSRYGLKLDSERPKDVDWTGAEIRNCARLAYRMRCSLTEAAKFIVPVATSNPQSIDKLRSAAHLKFLSASYAGTYRHAKAPNVPAGGVAGAARSYQE